MRKQYCDEMIKKAADEYLNEWGGKDTPEAKEAFAAYSDKVHGIVAQRDAYNRAMMGVDTSVAGGGGTDSQMVGDTRSGDLPDDVEQLPNEGEMDLDEVKDLMENIREYMVDERNPYMNDGEFADKYNNGGMFEEWSSELRDIIGDGYYNEFMSSYDEWEIPEKIDTPEEILAKQKEEDSRFAYYNSFKGEEVDPRLVYYNSFKGKENEDADKKEQMDSLEGDYAQIAPALQAMTIKMGIDEESFLQENVEKIFTEMLLGREFEKQPGRDQALQEIAYGNDVLIIKYENFNAELEVLNERTVNVHNEKGGTLDDVVFGIAETALDAYIQSGGSGGSISEDLIELVIENITNTIIEYSDPGKILQDGDVRISVQPFQSNGLSDQSNYSHKIEYFFRGSEFLYSRNTVKRTYTFGEKYDQIMEETVTDIINQMLEE